MILLLLVAFLLELVAFFSFASLALMVEMNATLQLTLYILLLVIVVAFWSFFMSPRSPKKLQTKKYYLSKAIIYLIAAFVLANMTNPIIGTSFIIVWLVDDLIIFKLQQISKDTRHKLDEMKRPIK